MKQQWMVEAEEALRAYMARRTELVEKMESWLAKGKAAEIPEGIRTRIEEAA
jgi:hypothetical protein